MQVEDPVRSGGAEERRVTAKERYLRDAYGAIRRKASGPEGGAIEGNTAPWIPSSREDDALMVIRMKTKKLTL
jgi:hypothetical protein